MDTNLKSNRKIRTIITIVILSLFAAGVVESYYVVRKNIASTFTVEDDVEEELEEVELVKLEELFIFSHPDKANVNKAIKNNLFFIYSPIFFFLHII